jgi:hypothetical protein
MKTTLFRLLPWLLIAMVGILVWQYPARHQGTGVERTLACSDLQKGCTMQLNGRPLMVTFTGQPKPLEAFQVEIKTPDIAKVTAHFSMEGMEMGFNLYTFKKTAPDTWQARVTLPVCVTGRRDWTMHLNLDDAPVRVPFVTDL